MNPRFPAPLNTYNPTVHATVEAIFGALVNIVPQKARADGCGSRSIILGGRSTKAGQSYVQYEILGGGGPLGINIYKYALQRKDIVITHVIDIEPTLLGKDMGTHSGIEATGVLLLLLRLLGGRRRHGVACDLRQTAFRCCEPRRK